MSQQKQFLTERDADGVIFKELRDEFREQVELWNGSAQGNDTGSTTYGIVLDGQCELLLQESRHTLSKGCYFAAPDQWTITGGRGMLVRVQGYRALVSIGGPLERRGRLRYIDGCTDTLLISPVKLGECCLNALYFPPRVAQTPHVHPSVRLGAVLAGRGYCDTEAGSAALEPGLCFCLPSDLSHCFRTEAEQLIVAVYHPDSDFGPRDNDHPMINRTIVDGVSANQLPRTWTKDGLPAHANAST